MQLTSLDWWIVVISLVVSFIPALVLARRAGTNASEFFTSGRSAPWWLIGVSMVATTFSTDTPNLVTDLVRSNGVANNWAWWSFLLTGMATVFFYARLWRRSGVMTDLEFYEVRYSGQAATAVRIWPQPRSRMCCLAGRWNARCWCVPGSTSRSRQRVGSGEYW
jgi:solute:Na+ symporter, SSS family